MPPKHPIAHASLPWLMLALLAGACDSPSPQSEGEKSESPTSDNPSTGSEPDDDDDSDPSMVPESEDQSESEDESEAEDTNSEDETGDDLKITAKMRVIDASNQEIAGFGVQFCGPIVNDENTGKCFFGSTDDTGEIKWESRLFEDLVPGWWTAKFLPAADFPDKKYAGNSVRLDLEKEKNTDAGAIFIPEVESLIELDPEETELQELALTDKLTLKVAPSDIDFLSPSNHDVGAVRLEKKYWPTSRLEGEEVLGMWAFSLFGNQAKEDEFIDFHLDDALGLNAGSEIHIYELYKELGEFRMTSEAQVSSDGQSISPKSGNGLHYLTWMAVTVPND